MSRATLVSGLAVATAVIAVIAGGATAVSAQRSPCPPDRSETCHNSTATTPTDPDALPTVPVDDWNTASGGPLAPAGTTASNPLVESRRANATTSVISVQTSDTGATGELDGLIDQPQATPPTK